MDQDSRRQTRPVGMLRRRQTLAGTLARRGGAAARKRNCERKAEAERFLSGIKADLARGIYVNPAAGKVRLREYAGGWLAVQTFDESTREATRLRLRLHVFPTLGDCELRALRPSVVQAWTRGLQQRLTANYVRVFFCEPVGRAVGGCRRRADRQESVRGRAR